MCFKWLALNKVEFFTHKQILKITEKEIKTVRVEQRNPKDLLKMRQPPQKWATIKTTKGKLKKEKEKLNKNKKGTKTIKLGFIV